MQQPDYTSSNPYYHYPQNPNSAPSTTPSPTSYASAPPYTSTYNNTPNYPDLLSSSPAPPSHSYNPPPPPPPPPAPVAPPLQQPQLSSPFPSFESHSNYQPYYPSYNSSSVHRASRIHSGSEEGSYPVYPSSTTSYPSIYPTTPNYDHQTGSFNNEPVNNYGNYGELGQDIYTRRSEKSGLYGNINNDGGSGYGDGVFAYKGSSKVEPYGARGTSSKSSTWSTGFDDFGRPIGYSNSSNSSPKVKIVKASPKVDTIQDVKSGVQKFRVKLLAESGGMSTQDVLCQIGLDGIRMLDPSTSRTLRIYPLDTITRCDVTDSSTFAFWSKSSVDIEPRRIRLQSNSYTTSTLLDTVTAATVQFKEMGGRIRPSESPMVADQPTEKKKGLVDWINIVKPVNEEKDHWVPDEAVSKCTACGSGFNAFVRKHHCRNCGDIFCDKCTQGRTALTADENAPVVRVCDRCMAEVTRRLSSAKEAANRSTGLRSHEELAKKLQEEMERNRRESSGSRSDRSGRMKEVACPTCTVHLQVQVPSSGSETIECGVCQHPFLVSSH